MPGRLALALRVARRLRRTDGEDAIHRLASARLAQLLPSWHALGAGRWRRRGVAAAFVGLAVSPAIQRLFAGAPALAGPTLLGEGWRWRALAGLDALAAEARRAALWAWQGGQWARITLDILAGRALGRAGLPAMRELSLLAQATVAAAWRWAEAEVGTAAGAPPPGYALAVLAEGKLGAHELNVSSDLDLQFIAGERPGLAAFGQPQLARARQVARSMLTTLDRERGHGYRIDLDLRPHGRQGGLVIGAGDAQNYYQRVGQSWERMALLRARHLAGAAWVSADLLARLAPWMAPATSDPQLVAEVRRLKNRAESERRRAAAGGAAAAGIDIKHGPGGIRDIELFVQVQQLLWAGAQPELRVVPLTAALAALARAGHLPPRRARRLARAYLKLRWLENVVQAQEDQQTHLLPAAGPVLERLAWLWRLPTAADAWRRARALTRRVRRLTAGLFRRPALPAHGALPPGALAALSPDRDAQWAALSALGLAEVPEAAAHLEALAEDPASIFHSAPPAHPAHLAHLTPLPPVTGPANVEPPMAPRPTTSPEARALAPLIIAEAAASADPLACLRQLSRIEPKLRAAPGLVESWLGAPLWRRRLVALLGASEPLGGLLLAHPAALAARGGAPRAGPLPPPSSPAELAGWAAQGKLAVALAEVDGAIALPEVQRRLSDLAERVLAAAWARAVPAGLPLTALGLGRLGAGELDFASDLDLVLVLDADPDDGQRCRQAMAALQNLIAWLDPHHAGPGGYPIDLRLRPLGGQGSAITLAASLLAHHARGDAALWERLAWLRARPLAGCPELAARLLAGLTSSRYPAEPAEPAELAGRDRQTELRRQVAQLRQDLATEHQGPQWGARAGADIRYGPGGSADVEFLLAFLQHLWAGRHPQLRLTGTLPGLDAVAAAGLLGRRQVAMLVDAWTHLRGLESHLRMAAGRPTSRLCLGRPELRQLARRQGGPGDLADQSRLLAQADSLTRRVRQLYLAVMAPRPASG